MKNGLPDTPELDVQIVASLPAEWKDRCEELLYFNPQQELFRDQIMTSIHSYGMPSIKVSNGVIQIMLGESFAPSTFFALISGGGEKTLAGLVLFTREENALLCIHLSVEGEYTSKGSDAHYQVAHRLLEAVRGVAVRVAGVDQVLIYYNRHSYSIPIQRSLIS